MRTLVFATLMLLAAAAPAHTQTIAAGTRVRVSAPDFVAPLVGSVQAVRGDTLVLLEDGAAAQVWSIPRATVTKFEVSQGFTARDYGAIRRDAFWGTIIGGATFLIAAEVLQNHADSRTNYKILPTTLVGMAIGGGAGALYGARQKTESWQPRPTPRGVAFVPDLQRRGGMLAISVGF